MEKANTIQNSGFSEKPVSNGTRVFVGVSGGVDSSVALALIPFRRTAPVADEVHVFSDREGWNDALCGDLCGACGQYKEILVVVHKVKSS